MASPLFSQYGVSCFRSLDTSSSSSRPTHTHKPPHTNPPTHTTRGVQVLFSGSSVPAFSRAASQHGRGRLSLLLGEEEHGVVLPAFLPAFPPFFFVCFPHSHCWNIIILWHDHDFPHPYGHFFSHYQSTHSGRKRSKTSRRIGPVRETCDSCIWDRRVPAMSPLSFVTTRISPDSWFPPMNSVMVGSSL
jgi:hypothetical protein